MLTITCSQKKLSHETQLAESGLKKSDKLLKRVEFVSLSRNGMSVSSRHFIAAYKLNRLNRIRLGITVTRKVGNAVVRNRIKRQVREYYRLNRQRIDGHFDINIIAKKSAAGLTTRQVNASLDILMDRIKPQ